MFILNLLTCVDEFEGGGMAAQEADMMMDESPSGDGAGGKPGAESRCNQSSGR